MSDGDKLLSRDDLFLLMKSYENSVTLNTTLLDHQKQVLEKQNAILDKQKNTCEAINKILDKLKTFANNGIEMKQEMRDLKNNYLKSQNSSSLEHVNLSKEHTKINMRIYLSYAGLIAMILSLLTLINQTITKFDLIDLIAKHLGVI